MKRRSRIFAIVLVIAIIATTILSAVYSITSYADTLSDNSGNSENSITGTWYSESYGISGKLKIKENNTYYITIDSGIQEEGDWSFEDNILTLDKNKDFKTELTYNEKDKSLALKCDDYEYIFYKKNQQKETYKKAKNISIKDFYGTWAADKARYDTYTAPLSQTNVDSLTLTISKKNKISLKITENGSILVNLQNEEFDFNEDDGVISFSKSDENNNSVNITSLILKDGNCLTTIEYNDIVSEFIMSKS